LAASLVGCTPPVHLELSLTNRSGGDRYVRVNTYGYPVKDSTTWPDRAAEFVLAGRGFRRLTVDVPASGALEVNAWPTRSDAVFPSFSTGMIPAGTLPRDNHLSVELDK
jgi:hypothetical protein